MSSSHPAPRVTTMSCEPAVEGFPEREPSGVSSSFMGLGERRRLREQESSAASVSAAPARATTLSPRIGWVCVLGRDLPGRAWPPPSPRACAVTRACSGAASATFARSTPAGRSRRGCGRSGGRPGGRDGACSCWGSRDRQNGGGGVSRRSPRSRYVSGFGERRTPLPDEPPLEHALPRRGQWVKRSLPLPTGLGDRLRARELSHHRACRLPLSAGLRER